MQVVCVNFDAMELECTYTNTQEGIMKSKYTSLRVAEERKMALEKAAIEISYKTGVPVKWTEIAMHLFDNYLGDAKKDLMASTDIKRTLKKS